MNLKGAISFPPLIVVIVVAILSVATYFYIVVSEKTTLPSAEETGEPGELANPQIETVQPPELTELTENENVNASVKTRPAENIENRALLAVIENNFSLSYEIEKDYQKYKFFVDMFLSSILKVDRKDLSDKSLVEIVDLYFEDYLAGQFREAAKNYGKIAVLTDETASYDNFKKTLLELNNEGRIVDVLLHLHGDADSIYFYNQEASKSFIKEDLAGKLLNLGFVYQTVCYGGQNVAIWIDLGARVASGAKGVNNFVILAPEKFLNLWLEGKTYYEAVNEARDLEVSSWNGFGKFLPGTILDVTEDDLEESRMIFAGQKDYTLEIIVPD